MLFTHNEHVYQQQLQQKRQQTLAQFASYGVNSIATFSSPITAYRFRAEFKIRHADDGLHYAMHTPGDKSQVYTVEHFPVAAPEIQRLMPELLRHLTANTPLRTRLFQVEFLTTTKLETVISLVYHKPLTPEWESHAHHLATALNVAIIGRARKQKCIIGQDFATECFTIAGRDYTYRQHEGSFTQPNAAVCQAMLEWAHAKTTNADGDLLELYCGNGNFTLPLASNFGKVLATEVAKSGIAAASYNCDANQITNVTLARLSSEEICQALERVRPFRRLAQVNLDSYEFSTLFVDPPRAGLDDTTRRLAQRFKAVVYVSCNPDTLARDLDALKNSHQVADFALFDQFPYTEHRECGVILQAK